MWEKICLENGETKKPTEAHYAVKTAKHNPYFHTEVKT